MTTEKQQKWNNWLHYSLTNQRKLSVPTLKFRSKLTNEKLVI